MHSFFSNFVVSNRFRRQMPSFIKYLLQLVLAPARGWEDITTDNPDPRDLFRKGLMPLLYITAASELLTLCYHADVGIAIVCIRAFIDFAVYFLGYFTAKLIFDTYLRRLTDGEPDQRRSDTIVTMCIGLMAAIQLVENIVPWNLVVLRLLPLYSVLVLYNAASYVHISDRNVLNFTMVAFFAIVALPLAIYYLFSFLLSIL